MSRTQLSSPLAVLRLSRSKAEWLGVSSVGAPTYRTAEVESPGAGGLADAARRALESASEGTRRCVVALAGDLLKQRVLEIPRLPRPALKRALARKAAALFDLDDSNKVLFAARRIGANKEQSASNHWLVVAWPKAEAKQLGLALRKRGFKVVRAVSSRLSHLDGLRARRSDPQKACLVIDAEEDEVIVSLMDGDDLLHQNVLPGDLSSTPALAISLMQEIRTLEGFWRKRSRGAELHQTLILGLESERGRALADAVRGVLPDAELTLSPDDGGHDAGRAASLGLCATSGVYSMDLSAHLPVRQKRLMPFLLSLGLVLVSAALSLRGSFQEDRASLQTRALSLRAEVTELERLRRRNAEARDQIGRLMSELSLLERSAVAGVSLDACLRDAFRAFGEDARLLTLAVEPLSEGGVVIVQGTTEADPLDSTRILGELRKRFEASASYVSVQVEAPAALPEMAEADARHQLLFTLRAHYEAVL